MAAAYLITLSLYQNNFQTNNYLIFIILFKEIFYYGFLIKIY